MWENEVPSASNERLAHDTPSLSHNPAARVPAQKCPLGLKLVQSLINLLFKQGYGVGELDEEDRKALDPNGIELRLIWSGGLQFSETRQNSVRDFDANRVHVLRVLLMCLASQVYSPDDTDFNYFVFCTANGAAPFVPILFYSLLNTILTYTWQGYVLFLVELNREFLLPVHERLLMTLWLICQCRSWRS